jgi:quercetin dioxygenase-like cupin family protein
MTIFPILDLSSFLPFEKGKRTTLTLVDLPAQTKLVLAALDGGAEIAPHAVPYEAGVLVLSGALEVMLGDTWHPAKPGQYLPVPIGVRHAVRALESSHFLVVHARGITV